MLRLFCLSSCAGHCAIQPLPLRRTQGEDVNHYRRPADIWPGLGSLRGLDSRQAPQPIFRIIFGDDGALSCLSRAQALGPDFRISHCSSDAVALAELHNAHCPLTGAARLLGFGDFLLSLQV